MRLILLFIVSLALLATGCATDSAHQAGAEGAGEKCVVCKMNADLACVDVTVDKQTPRMEYGGKMYYFCSEDCRATFAKNPEKYIK